MRAARLVIPDICRMRLNRPFFPQQRTQRHQLRSKAHINRYGTALVWSQIDLFELKVAGELLDDFGCRIKTGYQCSPKAHANDVARCRNAYTSLMRWRCSIWSTPRTRWPSCSESTPTTGSGCLGASASRISRIGRRQRRDRSPPNVGPSIGLNFCSSRPEAHGLHENLGAGSDHEGVVARCTPSTDAVCDVGADIVLSFARKRPWGVTTVRGVTSSACRPIPTRRGRRCSRARAAIAGDLGAVRSSARIRPATRIF
jgi:hypothetical protein